MKIKQGLIGFLVLGAVLLSVSIAVPPGSSTVCFPYHGCVVYQLRGDHILACPTVSMLCVMGETIWENPLIIFFFWTIDAGIIGFSLLLFVLVYSLKKSKTAKGQGGMGSRLKLRRYKERMGKSFLFTQ